MTDHEIRVSIRWDGQIWAEGYGPIDLKEGHQTVRLTRYQQNFHPGEYLELQLDILATPQDREELSRLRARVAELEATT